MEVRVSSRNPGHRRRGPVHRAARQSGQNLFEVALVMPFLVVLVLGVIDLGRFAYEGILVGNASRAAVAYGAQAGVNAADSTGIQAAACQDFAGSNTCGLTVSSQFLCQCDDAGTIGSPISCTTQTCATGSHEVVSLQVTSSDSFSPLFGYPGIPSSVSISRTATMRMWQGN